LQTQKKLFVVTALTVGAGQAADAEVEEMQGSTSERPGRGKAVFLSGLGEQKLHMFTGAQQATSSVGLTVGVGQAPAAAEAEVGVATQGGGAENELQGESHGDGQVPAAELDEDDRTVVTASEIIKDSMFCEYTLSMFERTVVFRFQPPISWILTEDSKPIYCIVPNKEGSLPCCLSQELYGAPGLHQLVRQLIAIIVLHNPKCDEITSADTGNLPAELQRGDGSLAYVTYVMNGGYLDHVELECLFDTMATIDELCRTKKP
jgi:hypothetical protein